MAFRLDPFGRTVAEGLVVAYRHDVLPALIDGGETGFLAPSFRSPQYSITLVLSAKKPRRGLRRFRLNSGRAPSDASIDALRHATNTPSERLNRRKNLNFPFDDLALRAIFVTPPEAGLP